MAKKIRALAAALLLSLVLSGCGGFNVEFNPEELYALPELPAKYTELNARLNAILEDGAEYAAPAAGTNIQPVQLTDLDGDGLQELVVFHAGEEGGGVADYYDWQEGGTLQRVSSVRLSITMAELNQGRVISGALRDDLPAVFVTGVTTPVSTELVAAAVTDILAAPEQELVNAALSNTTGVTSAVNAFRGLYPMDINGDGAIEVPSPAVSPHGSEFDQRIDWMSYNGAGEAEVVLRTHHNMEDGWYLQLPESWTGRVEAERSVSGSDASVTFYMLNEEAVRGAAILRITSLTGTSREIRATRGNRFPLSRQSDVIYTAELPENPPWDQAMTAEEVRSAFSLIVREWIPGET